MADPELLARRSRLRRSRFRGAKRLARNRLTLLLAALVAIELLELLDVDVFSFGFALVAAVVLGFVYLWGRSVFGLLFGEGV